MHVSQRFMFGTATAAYQIEGSPSADGRTPSIWDAYSHTPGKTVNGDTGDVACDSYRRWKDDLDLLADLGVDAYRLSISVPRIIPTPDGAPNQAGLDHYERIIDALRDRGIRPVVTLYHWDLPQYMGEQGGWLNRDTAYRMADYARIVARRLGDVVDTYTTLNEPWCSSYLSYGATEHAPGLGLGAGCFPTVHHLNLAHGLMAEAVRAEVGTGSKVSVTLNLQFNRGDADAVHRTDLIGNRVWLDPMLRGYYPAELFDVTRKACDWSFVRDDDLKLINQPIDVLGVNYYSSNLVALAKTPHDDGGATAWPCCENVDWLPTPGEHTAMGWNIDPQGLTDLLVRVHNEYPSVPLVVTENGMACDDVEVKEPDGTFAVHDDRRIEYLKRHLAAVGRAIRAGVPVEGYFLWSLMDNFEWAFGYTKRFGIVRVDYEDDCRRVPKDSFAWYRKVIADRELPEA